MFKRQRRRQDRETRLLRATLDKLGSQQPPNIAIAHLEQTISSVLQRSESAQAARDAIVVHLWHKVIDQEHEVTVATRQLVSLCASLTERLETQHREQQELLDVIRVLRQRLELPSNTATTKLIGGSVFATDPTLNEADVIDIAEPFLTPPHASGRPSLWRDEKEETDHDEPRRDDGWHAAR